MAVKTSLFKEGMPLFPFICDYISSLQESDVVVITSKIVALSQRRTLDIKEKEKAIRKSAKKIIKTPWALLSLTNDGWNINAGIDESNAAGKIILMPHNPFSIAQSLRSRLRKTFGVRKLGVIITDTKSIPLRVGTMGRAIAYSGFDPIRTYKGKKDLFGRESRFTESNVADALAAAAVLVMGEGNEQIPIVRIRNAPVAFSRQRKNMPLSLSPEKDIYKYVYKNRE